MRSHELGAAFGTFLYGLFNLELGKPAPEIRRVASDKALSILRESTNQYVRNRAFGDFIRSVGLHVNVPSPVRSFRVRGGPDFSMGYAHGFEDRE